MEARARVATARESGSVGSLGQAEGGLRYRRWGRAHLTLFFALGGAGPWLLRFPPAA